MRDKSVVSVGHVCIDHNFVHDKLTKKWGSTLLYISKYFKLHYENVNVVAIAPHGKDFKKYATDLDLYPHELLSVPTLIYKNIVADDGKRIQYCYNSKYATPLKINNQTSKVISQADLVFISPLTPQYRADYLRELLAQTMPGALKILVPQGYLRNIDDKGLVSPREFIEAGELLPLFDLVILSNEDLPEALSNARKWKMQSPETIIIITENKLGATVIGTDHNEHVATKPIAQQDIINPIGCGDVFAAATAFHYLQNRNLAKAITFGHRAASESLLNMQPVKRF